MLGEFHVNAVRERPAARDEARAEVRDLTAWKPAIADAPVLEPGGKSRIAASFRIGCAVLAATCSLRISRLGREFGWG